VTELKKIPNLFPFAVGRGDHHFFGCSIFQWTEIIAFTMTAVMQTRLQEQAAKMKDLEERLRLKENAYEELERDCNFYALQANELTEIIELRTTDEVEQTLVMKSIMNAELTMQVQELRDNLNESSKTIESMKQERNTDQRMLRELGNIVRSLQKVSIDYDRSIQDEGPMTTQEEALINIKRKIEAIESHRQSLIEENKKIKEENGMKENKIDALESLFHSMNSNRAEEKPPETIEEQLSRKHRHVIIEKDWETSTQVSSEEDGNTEIILMAVTSLGSCEQEGNDDEDEYSDSSSFSSLEAPVIRDVDIEQMMAELILAKDKHSQLQHEHIYTLKEVASLEGQLTEVLKKVAIADKKQDMREGLLRDVVFQYKELQKDHDDTVEKIKSLEAKMGSRSRTEERRRDSGRGLDKKPHTLSKLSLQEENPAVEEATTFDLSESSVSASTAFSTCARAHDGFIGGLEIEFERNIDDYKSLESECARLEHEYDNALANISSIEGELDAAKQDAEEARQKQKEIQNDLTNTVDGRNQLEVEHRSALDKTATMEQELKVAKQQARVAREKQKQRERDLSEVILQYKQLAQKNESAEAKIASAEAKIASVQHELNLTKKEVRGRDLIYEYRKLEQNHEDASINIQRLEHELKLAKTDVCRNKEEAKGTRKRLAGCHFHYKKLQQQYDEIVARNAGIDRELKWAKDQVKKFKTQEESWTSKLLHIRQRRGESETENKRLIKENREMKTFCDELLCLVDVEPDPNK
jgi:chromosome segregation ATPase